MPGETPVSLAIAAGLCSLAMIAAHATARRWSSHLTARLVLVFLAMSVARPRDGAGRDRDDGRGLGGVCGDRGGHADVDDDSGDGAAAASTS